MDGSGAKGGLLLRNVAIFNNIYLFPMCLLATDSEAIAETVSASSVSRCRASLREQASVEAQRRSERQYLPASNRAGKRQLRDSVTAGELWDQATVG